MSAGIVLVTGFGPFGIHKINASWEAVKRLPKEIENYTIETREIAVSYEVVNNEIPRLWKTIKPNLTIHVGVSQLEDSLCLEKYAFRNGYNRPDICGSFPNLNTCMCDGGDCIATGINIEKVTQHINENLPVKARTSTNAGRYLCEYTYYTSLNIDNRNALFIHVPPLDKPFSVEQLTECIVEIIRYILINELNEKQAMAESA